MDLRDIAANLYLPYTVDEERMRILLMIDDGENGETEVSLPLKWKICGTCEGNGEHVNPSIDAHGLTTSDFEEDSGFREGYFGGVCDVPCNECGGRRIVAESSDPRFTQAMSDAWSSATEDCYAREMGY